MAPGRAQPCLNGGHLRVCAGWRWHNELYLGFWYFFERLLNDTSIRTDDPYEANLFYVPALAYYYR